MTDLIGVSAGILVILASYAREGRALRRCAIGSNVLFIVYAFQVTLWPIFVMHAILLPINVIRLAQINRGGGRATRAAPEATRPRPPDAGSVWRGVR